MQFLFVLFVVFSLFSSWFACAKTPLQVAFIRDNVNDRSSILNIEGDFEKAHPDIDLITHYRSSADYKIQLPKWLNSEDGPDVYYWFSGESLRQFIKQDLILPLDEFWQNTNLEDAYPPSIKPSVTYQNKVYASPTSNFSWGMYYNQTVFKKLNLYPPRTWSEFLRVCSELKENGIIPIALGNKEPWTIAAWFDYINIRVNGIDFHLDLIRGNSTFDSDKVRKTLSMWAELFNKGYVLEGHQKLKWLEAMPFMFRGEAGMVLMGSFLNSRIPLHVTPNIAFTSFPTISPEYGRQQLAPTDVYMVSSKTKQKEASLQFLTYMADPYIQQSISAISGAIPIHKNAQLSDSRLTQHAANMLKDATKIMQFFDRDGEQGFVNPAMEVFSQFALDRDIEKAINQLEQLRLKIKQE